MRAELAGAAETIALLTESESNLQAQVHELTMLLNEKAVCNAKAFFRGNRPTTPP